MAKNEVDSAIQTLLKLGCKVTKLWENASPTSAFAALRRLCKGGVARA